MQHGIDGVVLQQACNDFAIARITDDQRCAEHRAAIAGRKIVQDYDPIAALDELTHDVAADVTGAAGDQGRRGS
jgi:hypothetical protein